MVIVPIKMPYSKGSYYMASINKRGISISLSGRTRLEAIMRVWEEYTFQLYK